MRDQIIQAARGWKSTPYKHQGRLKGVGVDCAGLPICVAREVGLVATDFDVSGYGRVPDGSSLVAHCDRWMRRIEGPEMAAVIVIRFDREGPAQHLGILADYLHGGYSMIHALGTSDGRGRVVEHRLDESTLRKTVGFWRFPGVN